jgi:hypothetical protein
MFSIEGLKNYEFQHGLQPRIDHRSPDSNHIEKFFKEWSITIDITYHFLAHSSHHQKIALQLL